MSRPFSLQFRWRGISIQRLLHSLPQSRQLLLPNSGSLGDTLLDLRKFLMKILRELLESLRDILRKLKIESLGKLREALRELRKTWRQRARATRCIRASHCLSLAPKYTKNDVTTRERSGSKIRKRSQGRSNGGGVGRGRTFFGYKNLNRISSHVPDMELPNCVPSNPMDVILVSYVIREDLHPKAPKKCCQEPCVYEDACTRDQC